MNIPQGIPFSKNIVSYPGTLGWNFCHFRDPWTLMEYILLETITFCADIFGAKIGLFSIKKLLCDALEAIRKKFRSKSFFFKSKKPETFESTQHASLALEVKK